jgi:hypothetical protein
VNKLRPVQFEWKNLLPGKKQIGLIAQEVAEVLPEIAVPDDSGMWSMNYSGVIPVLVKAIQELSAKVAALEAKV